MSFTRKLLAGATALALVTVSAGPVLADPPAGVTPRPADVVGVGSDTIGSLLDQFSNDYAAAHPKAASLLYGWDQTNPATGVAGDQITTKAGCPAIARPDGSSAGISALEANVTVPSAPSDFCVDFAGSSRGPGAGDPSCAPGGICFIELAGDAVTWATRDAASGGTDAPASLTLTQLKDIYLCKITNWAKVGGKNAPIEAFLPQTGSGTAASWLAALGGSKPLIPGKCVSDAGNTLQDNQGINQLLDTPTVIIPYSVADYLAQVYHSAPCLNSSCTGSPPCTPSGTQNLFGCDEHGVLGLGEIGGSTPATPWPLPAPPCSQCKINSKFTAAFQRIVYIVVRYAATQDHVPAYIEPFIGSKSGTSTGYMCVNPHAQKEVKRYGFASLTVFSDAAGGCGTPHGR